MVAHEVQSCVRLPGPGYRMNCVVRITQKEQLFLVRRIVDSPLSVMAASVPILLFVIPFTVLLSRKAKSSNLVMTILAMLVFTGIFIERLLFLIPVAHMNPFVVVLALVALAGPLAWMVKQGADEEGGIVEPA